MGVREDAINMVDALGRADDLSLKFRRDIGLGGEERAYGMAGATPVAWTETQGLQIADVDQLLHQHERHGFDRGYEKGAADVGEQLDRRHQAELGEYVGAVCDLVGGELLAVIVTSAVQALDSKGSTRRGIVDAVIAQVKREASALDDLAARARRGELFS